MTSPLVSTLVPVYNVRSYLPQMVASLQKQTYPNHEVVLVDDCSTDDSYAYLCEVAERDARFRVFRNVKNAGPSASINRAAAEAQGDLLARLDADDTALPDRVEKQVEFLLANPGIGYLGSDFYQVDDSGKRLRAVRATTRGGAGLRAMFLFANTICHSTVLYRRSVFDRVGGYDESLRASLDYDLLARLSKVAEGHILPHALVNYRIHATNISSRQFLLQRGNAAGVQEKLLKHYGFTFTPQELESHHQATIYRALAEYRIDERALQDIRQWLASLLAQNEANNIFPVGEFDRVVETIHNGLFARKNSSLTFGQYVRNLTPNFGGYRPRNVLLHVLHTLKNGL